jgi:hypothetical protein
MHGSLTPRRGGSVTFLLPDNNYIKKIQTIIESESPEDATDIVSCLILQDLFTSGSDFSNKKDDIPNLLGKKLNIKEIKGDTVTLSNNATLTFDKEFRPFDRQGNMSRSNLSVWILKGEIDIKTDKSSFKYQQKKDGFVKNNNKEIKGEGEISINDLIKQITDKEVISVMSPETPIKSYILEAVCKVLTGFKSHYNDCYESAICLLTKFPIVDFYLLFR